MAIVNREIPVGPSGLAFVQCEEAPDGRLSLLPGQLAGATEQWKRAVLEYIDAESAKLTS